MQLQLEAGYESMEGGVCAAAGFSANGCNCGLNPDKNKNDLGMIYSGRLCNAAAVYTSNRVKGAPILVTKKNLEATGGIELDYRRQSKGCHCQQQKCQYLQCRRGAEGMENV